MKALPVCDQVLQLLLHPWKCFVHLLSNIWTFRENSNTFSIYHHKVCATIIRSPPSAPCSSPSPPPVNSCPLRWGGGRGPERGSNDQIGLNRTGFLRQYYFGNTIHYFQYSKFLSTHLCFPLQLHELVPDFLPLRHLVEQLLVVVEVLFHLQEHISSRFKWSIVNLCGFSLVRFKQFFCEVNAV